MRLLQLDVQLLRLLDDALDGQLGGALADVVRAGGEPEIVGVRHRQVDAPSTWCLVVRGGGAEGVFKIDPKDHVTLAIVVHLHVADLVDEVRRDVALNFKSGRMEDGLDSLIPWPRSKANEEPS